MRIERPRRPGTDEAPVQQARGLWQGSIRQDGELNGLGEAPAAVDATSITRYPLRMDKTAEEIKLEALREKQFRDRMEFIQDTHPVLWSRIAVLLLLQQLQNERGGYFAEKLIFLHTVGYVFNVRRIGTIDIFKLIVSLEAYSHDAIEQGIAWVPIDQVVWAGSTDWKFGSKEMGFGIKETPLEPPADTRKLSGLA